jgi:hypothetical protein
LLPATVTDSLQRSEGKLHCLAAAERRCHFFENGSENAHRFPPRQTTLTQLLYDMSLVHRTWFHIPIDHPLCDWLQASSPKLHPWGYRALSFTEKV